MKPIYRFFCNFEEIFSLHFPLQVSYLPDCLRYLYYKLSYTEELNGIVEYTFEKVLRWYRELPTFEK